MLIAAGGLLGILLFLTYYLQQTPGYSPLVTGVAFLPISGGLVVASNLSTIVLMPRFGPKPLVVFRDAGRSGRDGLAGRDGPAHRVRRGRAQSASISQSPGLLITTAAAIPSGGKERAR